MKPALVKTQLNFYDRSLNMPHLRIAIAFVIVTSLLIVGCLPRVGTEMKARFKIAEGPLVTKTYKKLGISISLPKDVREVTVWYQNWYQRDTGSKELSFSLAIIEPPLFSWLENSTIWSGHVNVFTPEQLRAWNATVYEPPAWTNIKGEAKFATFDLIQTQTMTEQRVGYDQKNYRIDRKAKDGRVLMVTINRCEYTIQTGARERDLLMITNILQSVKFLEP